MYSTKGGKDDVGAYDEFKAKHGSQGLKEGYKFISNLFRYSNP